MLLGEILGFDCGYSNSKDSLLRIFPSQISYEECEMTSAVKMNIDGKDYFVGAGAGNMDLMKFSSEITKVLLLSDLYWAGKNSYYLVTGLPIGQYTKHKDDFRKFILSFSRSVVNGRPITIQDCKVVAQGVGALYSENITQDCIIVDVGGRTIDIGYFENIGGQFYLRDSNTLYAGMEGLYNDVAKAVNRKYDLSLKSWQAKGILNNGLKIDGVEKETEFLKDLKKEYFAPVIEELEVKQYPYRTTELLLCGGGAGQIKEAIQSVAPAVVEMKNPQFANALGFKRMGVALYAGQ